MNDYIVYLDMDGVLADFEHSIKKSPRSKSIDSAIEQLAPELLGLSDDEIKRVLAGKQEQPNLARLKKIFNDYRAIKYSIAGEQGFFQNLKPMPDAFELFHGVIKMIGKKPNILTAPMKDHLSCQQEKEIWMDKHFPGLYDKFYCTKEKHLFAAPNAILIDDRIKNTEPFEYEGGIPILHKNAKDTLRQLKAIVKEPDLIREQNKISYTGLVLDSEDQKKLLKMFPVESGWTSYAHHVTLNMGSYKGDRSLIGKKFPIVVDSFTQDDLVSAVGVIVPPGLTNKPNLHITIGVNKMMGGKPKMSNDLDWNDVEDIEPFKVYGTLTEVG